MRHPWLRLSSKVRAALVFAITSDLGVLALGVSGGLSWVGVLVASITSLAPVIGAWNQTETVFPPLPAGSIAVPMAALQVPADAIVTIPDPHAPE